MQTAEAENRMFLRQNTQVYSCWPDQGKQPEVYLMGHFVVWLFVHTDCFHLAVSPGPVHVIPSLCPTPLSFQARSILWVQHIFLLVLYGVFWQLQ